MLAAVPRSAKSALVLAAALATIVFAVPGAALAQEASSGSGTVVTQEAETTDDQSRFLPKCPSDEAVAVTSARRKRKASKWGKSKGRYRTSGRPGSTSLRGIRAEC
jgi:hypothetical protein